MAKTSQGHSHLLVLPRELRDIIYSFAGRDLALIPGERCSLRLFNSVNLDLLCVCREIYNEYKQQWSAQFRIYIIVADDLDLSVRRVPFAQRLPLDVALQAKYIEIEVDIYPLHRAARTENRKLVESGEVGSVGQESKVTVRCIATMLRQLSEWTSSTAKITIYIDCEPGIRALTYHDFRRFFEPTVFSAAEITKAISFQDRARVSLGFLVWAPRSYIIQVVEDAEENLGRGDGTKPEVVKRSDGTIYLARPSKECDVWWFEPRKPDNEGAIDFYGFVPRFFAAVRDVQQTQMRAEGEDA